MRGAVNCILFWATHKEKTAWCPQCRVSFSQLRVYRHLDGTPRDLPDLESVCLLKRTHWFQDYARVGCSLPLVCPTGMKLPPHLPVVHRRKQRSSARLHCRLLHARPRKSKTRLNCAVQPRA